MRHIIFTSILLSPIFLAVPSAVAAPAPEQGVLACVAETDDAARLACFDQAATSMTSAQSTAQTESAAAPAVAAVEKMTSISANSPEATPLTTEENFGLSETARHEKAKTAELREISSKVAEIGFLARGEVKITLENGQVWQQISSDSTKVRIRSGTEYTAIVKKASFGSHVLKLNKSKRLIRVRRIK